MNKVFLGIDLGTSSVKVLLTGKDGILGRGKSAYPTAGITGWLEGVKSALQQIDPQLLRQVAGIGLSSQVGTYITDTGEVIGWNDSAGKAELAQVKEKIPVQEQIEQLGMVHPDLISYPLPRLLYIQRQFPRCTQVFMPKDLLVRELTGNTVTDVFSWRGLCNAEKRAYAQPLLEQLGISLKLPPLAETADVAGYTTANAEKTYGLPEGIPVYTGCNDFFAGLLGLGVWDCGSVFELSGTSAHLGILTPRRKDGAFVSGPYFNGCVTYGGTKSSGAACDFAIRQLDVSKVRPEQAYGNPPVFLPYLNGERAPIYDENAKGVFFGITHKTTRADMAYAVLEGVVFSLYHIGQALEVPCCGAMITGGGSAQNAVMAQLKAALFDCDVYCAQENDASALGAAMLAMTGGGVYEDLSAAAKAMVKTKRLAAPDRALRAVLLRRFEIYKRIYENLKDTFAQVSEWEDEKK